MDDRSTTANNAAKKTPDKTRERCMDILPLEIYQMYRDILIRI